MNAKKLIKNILMTALLPALILGNLTMTMLSNGFVALGWSATMQSVTTGFFLLVLLGVSSNQVRFIKWRMDRKRAKEINARLGLS